MDMFLMININLLECSHYKSMGIFWKTYNGRLESHPILIYLVYAFLRGFGFVTHRTLTLTHLSLVSLLSDIDKQYSPRCDAAERGVPSGAIMFAYRISSKNVIFFLNHTCSP